MAIIIDLKDAAVHFDKLNKEMVKAAERGLHSAALRGVGVIKTQIIPSRSPQPVDRGLFRAGWSARRISGGGEIRNDEPHSVFVEEGVRAQNVKAGRAMIEAIAEWVIRKGLVKKPGRGGSSTAAATAIAWGIVARMKKRGIHNRGTIQGQGILAELVDKHIDDIIRSEVIRELKKVE